MNVISSVASAVAILLSIIYAILSLIALAHLREDKKGGFFSRYWATSFWWPYYDLYDGSVRKVILAGRIILPLSLIAYYFWFAC